MTKRKILCFLVYRIEKKFRSKISRPFKVDGMIATVHASSKASALRMLRDIYPGFIFNLVVNTQCLPTQLKSGYHCFNNLIAKDAQDATPLGHVLPNSPEWNERYGPVVGIKKPNISQERQDKIDKVQKRKDIFD